MLSVGVDSLDIVRMQKFVDNERFLNKLFTDYDTMSKEEKEFVWKQAGEIKQDCIDEVEKMSSCPATMYLILKELDNPDFRDVSRFVFEVLFGKPDEAFYTMIEDSKEDVYTLVDDPQGDITFYGFNFSKISIRLQNEKSDKITTEIAEQ